MNTNIGENIKKLRREKGITQEKLAEQLNVSFQAISKWERGDTYPDITMVIPIAGYFGVSTDELLGVDAVRNETQIKWYLDKYYELGALGKVNEKFDLMVKAHAEYPNDFRILEQYAWQLHYDPNCTGPYGHEVHKDELYQICYRILDDCTYDSVRYSALSILGSLFVVDGQIDKAIEVAKRFPNHIYSTTDFEIEHIYKRGTDEWWPWVQKNIQTLTDSLYIEIRNSALFSKLPHLEKINIFKKAISLLEIVYDDGDYNFYNYYLSEIHVYIAENYIRAFKHDEAIESLEKGLMYAKVNDELPQISKHTSFLVNRLTQDMSKISKGSELTHVESILEGFNAERYNDIKETTAFKELVKRYSK